MVEQRQSAIQRIQVGVVGLVVVLLFVTLATMVLDRVSDSPQTPGTIDARPMTEAKDETPDEPLAELGVTPVAKDESASQPATGTRPMSATPPRAQSAPATRPQ
ncbi:MAG: hypothetical protein ACK4ZE_07730 [Sphingorhabdus sp.]